MSKKKVQWETIERIPVQPASDVTVTLSGTRSESFQDSILWSMGLNVPRTNRGDALGREIKRALRK
jgi:hypothetical protein